MELLPLFFEGTAIKCLVVGGGALALRKLRVLIANGAGCRVVAREVHSPMLEFLKSQAINHEIREFRESDIDGVNLVICATDDSILHRQIFDLCASKNIFVNVVDNAELSTAVFPAIVNRSPVKVGVSSGATSPALTRWLRSQLESMIPASLGEFAEFLSRKRLELRSEGTASSVSRQTWEGVVNSAIPDLIANGKYQEAEEAFDSIVDKRESIDGFVSLVGAGPGDPDLLTLKAKRCIENADVVLYDNLISDAILDRVRRDAERVYVGKRRNFPGIRQEQINEMLIDHAKAGRRVVRLKGGDPFLFGRGGEEIETLGENEIPFEVVPGITAALGCAAYAGIPLTHRDLSQSVRFITGHLKGDDVNLDWPELARPNQTLVVYMGLAGLSDLTANLLDSGIDPETPVAVVSRGTLPDQQVVVGTVTNIAKAVTSTNVAAPTTTIIGQVVNAGSVLPA